jgi:hypothetical protein
MSLPAGLAVFMMLRLSRAVRASTNKQMVPLPQDFPRLLFCSKGRKAGNRHKVLQIHRDNAAGPPVQQCKEDPNMNTPVRLILTATALIILGGCVAVPAGPGYYYEPAPVVMVPAPVYYGPTLRLDVYGGRGGHPGRHHRGPGPRRGHR